VEALAGIVLGDDHILNSPDVAQPFMHVIMLPLYKLLPMVDASGWLRAHKSGERSLVLHHGLCPARDGPDRAAYG
jgi:hypothetical protein